MQETRERHGFDPWVGKIPWRRAWQPTPAFLPGESRGQRGLEAAVCGVAKSQIRLKPLSMHTTHSRASRASPPLPSLPLHQSRRPPGSSGTAQASPCLRERPVSSGPWCLPLAGPSPRPSPLTSHLLRQAHRDGPVSHNTGLPMFTPSALHPSDSLIFFPLCLPLLNLCTICLLIKLFA